VGLVVVLSLPFLLFAFVTTLLNHIEFVPIEAETNIRRGSVPGVSGSRLPAAG
jgi:hypothetical protein